jgi:hypothetical protein
VGIGIGAAVAIAGLTTALAIARPELPFAILLQERETNVLMCAAVNSVVRFRF